ncbi:MAG: DNA-processing protein DprA [Bacteroidia bacterium]
MTSEELKYKIALTQIPFVGSVVAKYLVSYCGGVEAIFTEKKKNLLKIPAVGERIINSIVAFHEFERIEEEIEFIRKNNIEVLFYTDKAYPARLSHCADAPVLIYKKGNADLNQQKMLAIVGTRNATDYGKSICEKIVDELSLLGVLIVSGLAYGIDITAHKAAVKNNLPTVGVVAHGLDRIYPSLHTSIAQKMISNGAIITEHISGVKPDRENFPMRNRIIAGMSDAVLVVEAARSGGALITADIANGYNRDVFAIPGRVNDPFSQGCNDFIKANKAVLVEGAADIIYLLNWELEKKPKAPVQKQLFVNLSGEEKQLVDLLQDKGTMMIDDICATCKLPVSKVSVTLLNLEFSGLVKSLPGKSYQLA